MKLHWNYWLQTLLAVATKRKSEMTPYLDNGYDVMNYFAKFEKFLPHSIIMPSFIYLIIPRVRPVGMGEGFLPPPPQMKIGSQNTAYKLGLSTLILI